MTVGRVASFRSGDLFERDDLWEVNRPQPPTQTDGKFVTTASMHLAVSLTVPQLPSEGVEIRAKSALSSPGGGYVVAAGVRAQGVQTVVASPLGTGPNSQAVLRSLAADDIQTCGASLVGDIGVGVTMIESDGTEAAIIAPGVESEPSHQILDSLEMGPHDLVHIDAADLIAPKAAEVLISWVEGLPDTVRLVLSVSPAVEDVPPEVWVRILRRVDVLTMNVREAAVLEDVLRRAQPPTSMRDVLSADAAVVRRMGAMGCEVQVDSSAPRKQIGVFRTKPVDTSGVGATHVAVMCASLLLGFDLVESCRRANAGAAIVLSHPTPFPLATREGVCEVMRLGCVPEDMRIPSL